MKHIIFAALIFCLSISGCSSAPSAGQVQTAIAQTQTAIPTQTLTVTPIPPKATDKPKAALKSLVITPNDFSTMKKFYADGSIETTLGAHAPEALESYSVIFLGTGAPSVIINLFRFKTIAMARNASSATQEAFPGTGLAVPSGMVLPINTWSTETHQEYVLMGFTVGETLAVINLKMAAGMKAEDLSVFAGILAQAQRSRLEDGGFKD